MNRTLIKEPQSVNSAFEELLNKMYISNVQNRLRQLNEPTVNDCKRWVWELIQNAKDSISTDKDKKTVDIKITVKEKELQFKHNGSPFTAKAQLGLLYKYSEGKVNDSESTGRFGTGFLTTHTLSKIVSVEGDVYMDETNTTLCGFFATMYRDGIDEPELLAGVEKMKREMIYTQETNGWTTYTYHLKTPHNEYALRLGLENFIYNIPQTMLFCTEIASIQLDNNGEVTEIIRGKVNPLDEEMFLTKFYVKGKDEYARMFIHTSIEKQNAELTKRFKTDRSIRLTACIEVDEEKNIIENINSPSHFCVLPLIGSEEHIMPIYLHSPDFEPDSERESLILIGDDILAGKDVISEGGINRMILKESLNLYNRVVSHLVENKYRKLYLLIKGLKELPNFEKNFNEKWFKEEIIIGYRNIASKYEIVETSHENQKIFNNDGTPNIFFPKDNKIDIQEKIYDLIKELFPGNVPLEYCAKEWALLAWKECGLFKIEDLCKYLDDKGNVNNLSLYSLDKFDWQNQFIAFVKSSNETLLKEYKLIPNRYGDFVSLKEENFAEGIGITDYTINCLKELGEDLNPFLLNKQINSISLSVKIDKKTFGSKINDQVSIIINKKFTTEETLKVFFSLLKIIPTDEILYEANFIYKQISINNYIKDLFPNLSLEKEYNDDLHKSAWRTLNAWCIDNLIITVSEYKDVTSLPLQNINKIEWINKFISFISNEIKEGTLNEYAIIPNQNSFFCRKDSLSKDIYIPEELKTEQAERFGLLLKKDLLHKEIDSINISNEFDINKVTIIINDIFINTLSENHNDSLDFAIFLIHLLPTESSNTLHNSQKKLLNIVQKYYYSRSKQYQSVVIKCENKDLWEKANKKIIHWLIIHLQGNKTIAELKSFLSNSGQIYDDSDIIIFLNDFYDYLKCNEIHISGTIIPDQRGNFRSLDDDFYRDNNVPDLLKDVLLLVNSDKDFRNILAEKSLSDAAQPNHAKTLIDISTIIDDEIFNIYNESVVNWDDESFKKAIKLLMIEWFPKNDRYAKDLFRKIYEKKEAIEMNVLWSLDERQRMQKARSIDSKLLDEFIENVSEVESLKEEKKKLKEQIEQLKVESEHIELSPKFKDIASEFPNITLDKIRELLKIEEKIRGWSGVSTYIPTSEEDEKRNYENGYKGEAYVYKELIKTGNYKKVIWAHKSLIPAKFEIVDYEGETHYIKEDYFSYDLAIETFEGHMIYVEVKSTRTSLSDADKIALPISTNEWKFVNQIKENDKYYLARIFDVENSPEGHYLSLIRIKFSKL